MDGVRYFEDDTVGMYMCLVEEFSEELENHIRNNLISICEGEYHSEKFSAFLTYKNTLKTFIERYEKKKSPTKVGLIGELLCHLLLPEKLTSLKVVSPYFNMEESGIKKGHDLVLFHPEDEELWITEVKSGEKGAVVSTTQKSKNLFNLGNKDLQEKLTSTGTNLWRNALKGMDTSLKDGITKDLIVNYLTEFQKNTLTANQKSETYNVVLCSCVFYDTDEQIDFKNLVKWKST